MSWYRVDFKDGDSKFFEIDKSPDDFRELITVDAIIPVERSLVLFPHKGEGGKDGLAAAQLKDMNPLYLVCQKEFINTKHIKSFGVVDTDNDAWKQISEKALGERHILTPKKSLLLT